MKIFIWKNGNSDSDFCPDENINMEENLKGHEGDYPSSNAHSGGIVILADNEEEAIKLFIEYVKIKNRKTQESAFITSKKNKCTSEETYSKKKRTEIIFFYLLS